MENNIGIKTRAMEKRKKEGAQKQTSENTDHIQAANPTTPIRTGQEAHDPAVRNPTEDITEDEIIGEFMRKDCSIGLDW